MPSHGRRGVGGAAADGLAGVVHAVHDDARVAGLTHDFYRYPARFSPAFARAIIDAFSTPGDLVFDPFMGGGTTLVEASAMGRPSLGLDISRLAQFIASAKTTILSRRDAQQITSWAGHLDQMLNLRNSAKRPHDWIEEGYQHNISCPETWPIRKTIELAISGIERLEGPRQRRFLRCALLRTGQWALDLRRKTPSACEFRERFRANISEMLDRIVELRQARPADAICLHRPAWEGPEALRNCRLCPPRLIVTSPPYPGVHVLYHRWQIHGRRETPAPFWIANVKDGQGESYYTFGGRRQDSLDDYFGTTLRCFSAICETMDRRSVLVQLVGFSDPETQLPPYLETMAEAGLREERPLASCDSATDGRVWRRVPNRKWYANGSTRSGAGAEVLLFHRRT